MTEHYVHIRPYMWPEIERRAHAAGKAPHRYIEEDILGPWFTRSLRPSVPIVDLAQPTAAPLTVPPLQPLQSVDTYEDAGDTGQPIKAGKHQRCAYCREWIEAGQDSRWQTVRKNGALTQVLTHLTHPDDWWTLLNKAG